MSNKRTPIGKFIHTTWICMNVRCGNGLYHRDSSKNNAYKHIDIKFTRDEFKNWCLDNKDHILQLTRPSIDRIDPKGHYTLDNIQILELSDNIRKERTKAKNGKCICYACKEEKDISLLAVDKRRENGKSTICRLCDNKRRRENTGL